MPMAAQCVNARELTSNVESRIEVKPSYGLGEDEITSMLQDSFSHAATICRPERCESSRLKRIV